MQVMALYVSDIQGVTNMNFKRRIKQDWTEGSTVKVGFMTMTVVRKVATPGDFRPDVFHLIATNGKQYTFQPHYGLEQGWSNGSNG